MTRLAQITTALVVAATVAACGGSSNTTPVVASTGTVSTETFTGTVPLPVAGVLQSDVHNFTVAVAGSISITLVSAGPPPTITMGLGLGNPSSTGTCAFLSGGTTLASGGSTAQLSGSIAAGAYCVAVVDVGNAAVPIAYTVTVAHT